MKSLVRVGHDGPLAEIPLEQRGVGRILVLLVVVGPRSGV